MKNQKKLFELPVALCPDVRSAAVKEDWQYYSQGENKFSYSMNIIDNGSTQTLVTTIYKSSGTPLLRIFLDDFKWITQIFSESSDIQDVISESEFGNLVAKGSWAKNWIELKGTYVANKDSVDEAQRFFKCFADGRAPLARLDKYQQGARERAVKEKNDRIRKSIDDVMLKIRPLPKDFEKWVNDEALFKSRYIFYDYKHGRKFMDGYCTICNTDVKIEHPHHNAVGKCPHCGKKVIFKAQRISTEVYDETNIAYIQPIKGGWVVRYFSVTKDYKACYEMYSFRNPQLYIHEDCREFDTDDIQKVYRWDNFRQTGEYRFCEDYYTRHNGNAYYLYTRNLKAMFKKAGNALQYFPISQLVKNGVLMNVHDLLTEPLRHPQLEFLAKLKLYNLTAGLINHNAYEQSLNLTAKGMQVIGVEKNDLKVLQQINPDLGELQIFRATRKYGLPTVKEIIGWTRENKDITTAQIGRILRYTTPHRAIRYISEQGERVIKEEIVKPRNSWESARFQYMEISDVCQAWLDYLDNCRRLRYDLKNEFVLFPLHLTQAHDETNKLVLKNEKKFRNQDIADQQEEYDRIYRWQTKAFLIRAPKNADEIIAEGQKLHHCVGSYVDKVAARETVILFIRKVKEPEKPFCTLEFLHGHVNQCYGHHDTKIPPEVQKFVDAWQRIKKPALQSTAIAIQEVG